MNVLANISEIDLIVCYVLVILCGIFYLLGGIMLLVKRDQRLISKKVLYRDPENFCVIYGILEIVIASIIMIISIVGLLLGKKYWQLLICAMIFVIVLLIIQYVLQKKYRLK